MNTLADGPIGSSRTDAELVHKKFDEKKNECAEKSITGFVLGFVVRDQVLKRYRIGCKVVSRECQYHHDLLVNGDKIILVSLERTHRISPVVPI